MAPGELLQPDLTDHAEFVRTYDRLSADECAEIQTREVLCASWAERRVRDVAGRILEATKPIATGQSPNLGTPERWTAPWESTVARSLIPGPSPTVAQDLGFMPRTNLREEAGSQC
jgi:hypothetical protein